MIPALIAPASPLWFFARAAGFVSLILLTASVCLGMVVTLRLRSRAWPLFLSDDLHAYTAVLFFVFLTLHVLTVWLDPFTRFGLTDVVVPFASTYRRLWLGLGVAGAELALAMGLSVYVRRWIGYRAWRILHYGTYAVLPMALVHGMATGTDTRSSWGIAIYGACLILVGAMLVLRISSSTAPVRWPLTAATCLGLVVLGSWLSTGPLRSGWAHEAGTPQLDTALATPSASAAASVPLPALAHPFVDRVTGVVDTRSGAAFKASGQATGAVDLAWAVDAHQAADGSLTGTLEIDAASGRSICTAGIEAGSAGGIQATCAPAGAQGGLTFVLRLRQRGASALGGTLQVEFGSSGGVNPPTPSAPPAGPKASPGVI
jgi:sulfoxide reductase heme-binding subunit YedZ